MLLLLTDLKHVFLFFFWQFSRESFYINTKGVTNINIKLIILECAKRKKPSCGSIDSGTVTSDCKSGCVKIVYRPRYTQKTLGNLRLNVWVGISEGNIE